MDQDRNNPLFDKILKLGNPLLYQISEDVISSEINSFKEEIDLLHDLILECRRVHGFGRGIAAPQIGLMKRIVCLNIDGEKYTLYNPYLSNLSEEKFQLWDDCMSFPGLLVKVERHQFALLHYKDENWEDKEVEVLGPMSELLQHEIDHLDGILATQRAMDNKSFRISEKP